MSYNKPIKRIAIVGTGVIGASWAAQYLARGFDVVATDPAPNAEANLRKYIDDAWKDLTTIGLSKGASRDRLTFTTDLKDGLFDIVAAGTIARCGYRGDYAEVTRVFEMLRPFSEMSIFESLRKR